MGKDFIFRPPEGQDHIVVAELLTMAHGRNGKDHGIGVWTKQLDDGTVSIHCKLTNRFDEVRRCIARLGCELIRENEAD